MRCLFVCWHFAAFQFTPFFPPCFIVPNILSSLEKRVTSRFVYSVLFVGRWDLGVTGRWVNKICPLQDSLICRRRGFFFIRWKNNNSFWRQEKWWRNSTLNANVSVLCVQWKLTVIRALLCVCVSTLQFLMPRFWGGFVCFFFCFFYLLFFFFYFLVFLFFFLIGIHGRSTFCLVIRICSMRRSKSQSGINVSASL